VYYYVVFALNAGAAASHRPRRPPRPWHRRPQSPQGTGNVCTTNRGIGDRLSIQGGVSQ
jgi:hypothetical protein